MHMFWATVNRVRSLKVGMTRPGASLCSLPLFSQARHTCGLRSPSGHPDQVWWNPFLASPVLGYAHYQNMRQMRSAMKMVPRFLLDTAYVRVSVAQASGAPTAPPGHIIPVTCDNCDGHSPSRALIHVDVRYVQEV